MTERDLECVMEWRMRPDITKWMDTDPRLTIEGQREWFSRISTDATKRYWIVEVGGTPAGVINLINIDRDSLTAEWGYYVGEKSLRSMQLAISLELSLYAYCFEVLGLGVLRNEPLGGNVGTIKLHEMCGSRVVRVGKGEVVKNGVVHDRIYMEITKDDWINTSRKLPYTRIDFE